MRKLLIATDLDATLLDHQTYSYDAALSAIKLLQNKRFPIIFNSSKTTAEQTQIRHAIEIQDPFVVENGAAVVIPSGQLDHPEQAPAPRVQKFGVSYNELIETLKCLRQQSSYQFRGFADMSAAKVAEITGLSIEEAQAAKQRVGSEPLLWQDTEAAYLTFTAAVESLGLQNTRGGRFRHVTAKTDKGTALKWLVAAYRRVFPQTNWTVVALGDSPNDLPMLRVADIGVLVPNPHRPDFVVDGVRDLRQASQAGPVGWAKIIQEIVREFEQRSPLPL
ncbi:MAG: HAD-IIB family hydrolase [Cyanobacteria bacterium P01_D01_bin.123]